MQVDACCIAAFAHHTERFAKAEDLAWGEGRSEAFKVGVACIDAAAMIDQDLIAEACLLCDFEHFARRSGIDRASGTREQVHTFMRATVTWTEARAKTNIIRWRGGEDDALNNNYGIVVEDLPIRRYIRSIANAHIADKEVRIRLKRTLRRRLEWQICRIADRVGRGRTGAGGECERG